MTYIGGGGGNPVVVKLVRKIIARRIIRRGSFIGNPGAFASNPIFPHGIVGVFVSGDAKVGKECIIFQHVTIGSNYLPGSKRVGAPSIGDNCLLGAGAKIIGGVSIGNNCRIGANAVVTQDVPDNCTVVCEPPRVIRMENRPINHFYQRSEDGWVEVRGSETVKADVNLP